LIHKTIAFFIGVASETLDLASQFQVLETQNSNGFEFNITGITIGK
jgi:hypothetical protein